MKLHHRQESGDELVPSNVTVCLRPRRGPASEELKVKADGEKLEAFGD